MSSTSRGALEGSGEENVRGAKAAAKGEGEVRAPTLFVGAKK